MLGGDRPVSVRRLARRAAKDFARFLPETVADVDAAEPDVASGRNARGTCAPGARLSARGLRGDARWGGGEGEGRVRGGQRGANRARPRGAIARIDAFRARGGERGDRPEDAPLLVRGEVRAVGEVVRGHGNALERVPGPASLFAVVVARPGHRVHRVCGRNGTREGGAGGGHSFSGQSARREGRRPEGGAGDARGRAGRAGAHRRAHRTPSRAGPDSWYGPVPRRARAAPPLLRARSPRSARFRLIRNHRQNKPSSSVRPRIDREAGASTREPRLQLHASRCDEGRGEKCSVTHA